MLIAYLGGEQEWPGGPVFPAEFKVASVNLATSNTSDKLGLVYLESNGLPQAITDEMRRLAWLAVVVLDANPVLFLPGLPAGAGFGADAFDNIIAKEDTSPFQIPGVVLFQFFEVFGSVPLHFEHAII